MGPIFAKNILNWLAISRWSVNCCYPWVNVVGNCFFLCDLDIISFIVCHVFLMLCLHLLKVDS